jgi:hypothetical protein
VSGRRLVGRGAQVVAQCRAERQLEARRHGQGVEDRRPDVALPGFEGIGECGDLGLELGLRGPDVLQGFAAARVLLAGRREGGAGRLRLAARELEGLFGRGQFGGGLAQGLAVRRAARQRGALLGDRIGLALEALQAFGELAPAALEGRGPGFVGRHLFGSVSQRRLAVRGGLGGFVQALPGGLPGLGLASRGLFQAPGIAREPFERLGGVIDLRGGPPPVVGDFRQVLLGAGLGRRHLGLLARQVVALDQKALQSGGGGGLALTQVGQQGGGARLLGRCRRGASGARADRRLAVREVAPRALQGRLGLLGLDMQQHRLVALYVAGQVAVAAGLAGLAFQALELGLEGGDDVVEAFQIGLGGAQAQLGLVAPGMQAGDAGGLFQQGAPLGRLGVDQRADPALADQGARMGAGGGVREQQLHVAGPHVPAVDPVVGAAVALDPPRDLELVGVVHAGRRRAVAVVERQLHFGDVAARALGAAREDDVVHLAAAHALGRGLAHGPAQRLDQVRLATAVRADNSGEAGVDVEFGRVDEGLEPAQP